MRLRKDRIVAVGALVCASGLGLGLKETGIFSAQEQAAMPVVVASLETSVQAQRSNPHPPVAAKTLERPILELVEQEEPFQPTRAIPAQEKVTQAAEPSSPCRVTALALASEHAQVRIDVAAPCHPHGVMTVSHEGLSFTEQTDGAGSGTLTVPGMAVNASFKITFEDGQSVTASAHVLDALDYTHVVLQWAGGAGFELHAREFDAEYASEGHVWHGSSFNTVDRLAEGTGGQITRLGRADLDGAQMLDIYTLPVAISPRNGQVDVSVEAQVTGQNCEQTITSQTIERDSTGETRTHDVTFAVPSCAFVGDFLVLNNVLDGMKLAAR